MGYLEGYCFISKPVRFEAIFISRVLAAPRCVHSGVVTVLEVCRGQDTPCVLRGGTPAIGCGALESELSAWSSDAPCAR